MASFTTLPAELRTQILALSKPSSVQISITEADDLLITSLPALPGLLTTSKQIRQEALKWGLNPYPVLVGDDYKDILFDAATTLHLVITPSKTEKLAVTWTELYTLLGDALLDAQRIIVECAEPKRLARLFMLPEAEIVQVGMSCVEKGLFGGEVVASDRDTRAAMRGDVVLEVGGEEWVLREEVVQGFRGEVERTRAFVRKGEELEVDEAEALYFQVADAEAGEGDGKGERLTEGALEAFNVQMKELWPGKVYTVKSDPGGSVVPEE